MNLVPKILRLICQYPMTLLSVQMDNTHMIKWKWHLILTMHTWTLLLFFLSLFSAMSQYNTTTNSHQYLLSNVTFSLILSPLIHLSNKAHQIFIFWAHVTLYHITCWPGNIPAVRSTSWARDAMRYPPMLAARCSARSTSWARDAMRYPPMLAAQGSVTSNTSMLIT